MNITHSEDFPPFLSRYGERAPNIAPLLRAFGAHELCEWIHGLGIDTFVGSSGRVFPTDMKAAPLLRAWLKRLRDAGVVIHTRHRSEEHTSELQSLMRISYAVFCLKKKKPTKTHTKQYQS